MNIPRKMEVDSGLESENGVLRIFVQYKKSVFGFQKHVLRIFVSLRIRNQKLAFGKFRVPPAFRFVKILCSPEIYPPGY